MMIKPRYILLSLLPLIAITALIFLSTTFEKRAEDYLKKDSIKNEQEVPRKVGRIDTLTALYDTILTQKIKHAGSVGGAIAIVYKGDIVFLKCFGVRKKGEKARVDPHTVFRLASVSKTVTGVLAGILAEENLVDLDDKVVDYLPGFRLKDSVNTYSLSIRNILSHTSGLVPHAYDDLIESGVPYYKVYESLCQVNLAGIPGRYYGYQNVVFSLYDTIVQARTEQSFDALLHEKVFHPFGMEDASTGFSAFRDRKNIAYPHVKVKGGYAPTRLNDRYYSTCPAAGINASISDMAHYLLALTGKDSTLFNDRIASRIFYPEIQTRLSYSYTRNWDRPDSKDYGIGWRIFGYKGRQIAYHGGFVTGYRAEIALCREEEIGIAVLSNSPNGIEGEMVPLFLGIYFDDVDRRSSGLQVSTAH